MCCCFPLLQVELRALAQARQAALLTAEETRQAQVGATPSWQTVRQLEAHRARLEVCAEHSVTRPARPVCCCHAGRLCA